MKITKRARSEAKRLFLACQVQGRLDDQRVREAVRELTTLKPRGYLPILVVFTRLVRLELARRTARIDSAVPLDPPLRQQLLQQLEGIYGSGLESVFAEDPALIGGLRVRVGSDVYDGSVQARLAALKESF